jgi:hypothetical protein
MKKFLFQPVFFLSVIFAGGQERLSADRPDVTEGATLTPRRYFQAEFGLGAVNINDDDFYITHPDALLKYGLSKRFELQFVAEYLSVYEKFIPSTETTRGFTPCMLGFRAALWEEKMIIPKTSLIVRAGFPFLASKAFRPDHAQAVVLLAMENTITDKIGLGYNVGAAWDGFNSTPSWFYSLSSQFDLGEKWVFFLELFGSAQKNALAQNSIDTGLGFYINNDVKLDGYVGVGITDEAPKNFFGVGISFRLK